MKSGGNKYHGSVADFVRNTAFDAWNFTSKAATVVNAQGQKVPAPKPAEHQNELSLTFGGKVPHTANKLFFFVDYEGARRHTGKSKNGSGRRQLGHGDRAGGDNRKQGEQQHFPAQPGAPPHA